MPPEKRKFGDIANDIISNISDVDFPDVPISPQSCPSNQQVPYNSTELGQVVTSFRKANNIAILINVAVYEYHDNKGEVRRIVGTSFGHNISHVNPDGSFTQIIKDGRYIESGKEDYFYKGHSEPAIWYILQNEGIKQEQVRRIYSEREPCSKEVQNCNEFLKQSFPHAEITYSIPYSDKEVRKLSGKKLKDALKNEGIAPSKKG